MKVKAKRGFSLIEIIISVALLAILLIPISNVIIGTTKKNKDAEINNKVTTEAQKVLEELNSYDTLTFDSATNNFTMLNGQMILHYDSVNDTISTVNPVNPGTVTNNGDDVTISITGTKNTTLTRASTTPGTATATATATSTVATPDLTITSDGKVQTNSGSQTTINNPSNGLIFRIDTSNNIAVCNNIGTASAPVDGSPIGNIVAKADKNYIINLDKGTGDNDTTVPIIVYSETSDELKFTVNYQKNLEDNTRINIKNLNVKANIRVNYNYITDPIVTDEVYKFTVTAQAKSPLSTELDPAGNKVKKTLEFSGDTLKNIVLR